MDTLNSGLSSIYEENEDMKAPCTNACVIARTTKLNIC